jgi:CBS domain-containing protein
VPQAGRETGWADQKGMRVKTVAEIIGAKGTTIYSISPKAMVYDAVVELDARHVGALLVMSNGSLVGIVSERDCMRKVMLARKSAEAVPVEEVMTRDVIHVKPTLLISEAMAIMTEKRIRHLPVMEAGKLLGVVSLGDLVKATIAEQQFLIHELEYYITSEQG